MSKEFVDREIDEAHELIKHGEYEQAVNQLKDIKLRVHEAEAIERIKDFEKEHDDKLTERLKEIDESNKDPLRKQNDAFAQLERYAKSYLSFYDKLRKSYEIY